MNHWYDCGKFGVSIDFSLDMLSKLADGEKELIMESILLGYRDRIGTTETNFYVDYDGNKIHVATELVKVLKFLIFFIFDPTWVVEVRLMKSGSDYCFVS